MRIGKPQPFPRQSVQMRRLNFASLPAVTFDIPNPEIIREDKNNIRSLGRMQSESNQPD